MPDHVLLYDGVCNMCDSTVQFVLKRDKKKKIHFAGLQSSVAKTILAQHDVRIDPNELSTIYYIRKGKLYSRSTAILKVCMELNNAWPLMGAFLIVPKFIRDGVYSFIARNRYKWFGKKEYCTLPDPEERNLFLDLNEIQNNLKNEYAK
jgi:predicted DCC family thiol-disulfide oxidoreductase YuxK